MNNFEKVYKQVLAEKVYAQGSYYKVVTAGAGQIEVTEKGGDMPNYFQGDDAAQLKYDLKGIKNKREIDIIVNDFLSSL